MLTVSKSFRKQQQVSSSTIGLPLSIAAVKDMYPTNLRELASELT